MRASLTKSPLLSQYVADVFIDLRIPTEHLVHGGFGVHDFAGCVSLLSPSGARARSMLTRPC